MRLPLSDGMFIHYPYTWYVNQYVAGAKSLKRNGIRIPKIYKSLSNQFIEIELMKPKFDLQRFLSYDQVASAELMQEAEEALYRFAKTTRKYKQIGDFHNKQLIFDSGLKEWVLLDFIDKHKKLPFYSKKLKENNIFYQIFFPGGHMKFPSERAQRIFNNINATMNGVDLEKKKACFKKSFWSLLNPKSSLER